MYCLVACEDSRRILLYRIIAAVAAQFMLYYKGLVLVMPASFSLGNIVGDWLKRRDKNLPTTTRELKGKHSMNIRLLLLAMVYFSLYVYYTWYRVETPYN